MVGQVTAVCVSERKGTPKKDIKHGFLIENHGLEGDAHAGTGHRQVSLLSADRVDEFRVRNKDIYNGIFGENLLIRGIDCAALSIGAVLRIGKAKLEVTQIGKKCHSHCAIFDEVGDCIMPRHGLFTKVIRGGEVHCGDAIQVVSPYSAAVLTCSDSGAKGLRIDRSGPLAQKLLTEAGFWVCSNTILPDERSVIANELKQWCDRGVVLIITTGGTGFSLRDITPEATADVIERAVPGIAEALRMHGMTKTPRAMFGRGIAGIRGGSLIVNLPGSTRAVEESLAFLLPEIGHALDTLIGVGGDCART